jgi:hypothetical protein
VTSGWATHFSISQLAAHVPLLSLFTPCSGSLGHNLFSFLFFESPAEEAGLVGTTTSGVSQSHADLFRDVSLILLPVLPISFLKGPGREQYLDGRGGFQIKTRKTDMFKMMESRLAREGINIKAEGWSE